MIERVEVTLFQIFNSTHFFLKSAAASAAIFEDDLFFSVSLPNVLERNDSLESRSIVCSNLSNVEHTPANKHRRLTSICVPPCHHPASIPSPIVLLIFQFSNNPYRILYWYLLSFSSFLSQRREFFEIVFSTTTMTMTFWLLSKCKYLNTDLYLFKFHFPWKSDHQSDLSLLYTYNVLLEEFGWGWKKRMIVRIVIDTRMLWGSRHIRNRYPRKRGPFSDLFIPFSSFPLQIFARRISKEIPPFLRFEKCIRREICFFFSFFFRDVIKTGNQMTWFWGNKYFLRVWDRNFYWRLKSSSGIT